MRIGLLLSLLLAIVALAFWGPRQARPVDGLAAGRVEAFAKDQQDLAELPALTSPSRERDTQQAPSLESPFQLQLVHAEDGSPLAGAEAWIMDPAKRQRSDADGRIHWPKAIPPGKVQVSVAIRRGGQAHAQLEYDAGSAKGPLPVPGVITLVLRQQAPGSGGSPAPEPPNWARVIRRSSDALDGLRPVLGPEGATAPAWLRIAEHRLSELSAWDIILQSDGARARRPFRAVGGSQELRFQLRSLCSVEVDLGSPPPAGAVVSLYPAVGQPLDLRNVTRFDPDVHTVRWEDVRAGRYRVTVASDSHEFWSQEFAVKDGAFRVAPLFLPKPDSPNR